MQLNRQEYDGCGEARAGVGDLGDGGECRRIRQRLG